jgi:hypothetical protein
LFFLLAKCQAWTSHTIFRSDLLWCLGKKARGESDGKGGFEGSSMSNPTVGSQKSRNWLTNLMVTKNRKTHPETP